MADLYYKTRDLIYKTTHLLSNKGAGKRFASNDTTQPEQAEASTTLPSSYATLQTKSAPNNHAKGISTFNLKVQANADWAGCPTTRKSICGFTMTLLVATVHFGSRDTNNNLYLLILNVPPNNRHGRFF